MGTILCMSQMWFPQEKPSNQRKIRLRLVLSSKKKPSRQRATARFSVLRKRKGTLFGLIVPMLPNACPEPTQLQELTAQRVEFSANQCQNLASGRLMSASKKASDDKMDTKWQ